MLAAGVIAALFAAPAPAQSHGATTLDTVEVLGARHELSDFPGSISVIDGDTLRAGQRQVSLAESLVRAPGITVLDRQNEHCADCDLHDPTPAGRSCVCVFRPTP